ncbi:MAG: nucleotidyl transferase AbiEii/AbiGii toxin family protein [Bacteroidales bacterium]|nr:nucleotidyl transferase AbiEii/AbiGii toxin family protein [Bacteroidales bacterium]
MKGLCPDTEKVFHSIKGLDLLEEYLLIGGTALSLQIHHRLSEDLDFCKWQDDQKVKNKEIQWPEIEKKLEQYGIIETDILDLYQVNFFLNDVKISFYSNALANSREIQTSLTLNNIRLASIESLGAMKLEVMSRRFLFRDYYDVYSILMEGISLKAIVTTCGRYSRHRMKSKMILAILSNGSLFKQKENFELLDPRYQVSSEDIELFMREQIRKEYKL